MRGSRLAWSHGQLWRLHLSPMASYCPSYEQRRCHMASQVENTDSSLFSHCSLCFIFHQSRCGGVFGHLPCPPSKECLHNFAETCPSLASKHCARVSKVAPVWKVASCPKKFASKELSKDKRTERTWAHLYLFWAEHFARPALPEQFLRRAFLSGVLGTSPSISLCELFYMAWGLLKSLKQLLKLWLIESPKQEKQFSSPS